MSTDAALGERILNNVYVGLDIKIKAEVLAEQTRITSEFQLLPRKEFHITVAYFATMTEEQLQAFGNCLAGLASDDVKTLNIVGIGGASSLPSGEIIPITEYKPEIIANCARVLWWAVESNKPNGLIAFRNSLISIAATLNLANGHLRPTFFPHITIGSAGPVNDADKYSQWDVHSIDKVSTMFVYHQPFFVEVNKLHITNSTIHPRSLLEIANWKGSFI
jgi:2'-5' RNA ligase